MLPHSAGREQHRPLLRHLLLAGASSIFLVLMEWLFLVTKPSYLSNSTWPQRAASLGGALGMLVFLASVAVSIPAVLQEKSRSNNWKSGFRAATLLVPVGLLTGASVLMIDNFTTTVFGMGIRDTEGLWRLGYLLLIAGLFTALFRQVSRWESNFLRSHPKLMWAALGLFWAISVFGGVWAHWTKVDGRSGTGLSELESARLIGPRPNILILGSDGLNAGHLSVYGYERPTTPFLEKFAQDSLLCENAFPNAAHTGASVVSLLTGKLPTETGLVYPPDVLHGKDAYQSLPGMLKVHGYRAFQSSLRYYADAYDLNLRSAFDRANGRKISYFEKSRLISLTVGDEPALLLQQILERLARRLLHLTSSIPDPYLEATGQRRRHWVTDEERLVSLLEFIDESSAPFFAHVHLMTTHGPRFRVPDPMFSIGVEQNKAWMLDFYDDAIRRADRLFESLIASLEAREILDNTVVVVYSDHGFRYSTGRRLPLLIRFPQGQNAGRIRANVQNLDIAATLVDWLGLPRPAWMGGNSLLAETIDPCRPIFAARVNRETVAAKQRGFEALPQPPLYSLGRVTVTVCDRTFRVNLVEGIVSERPVPEHTGECSLCPSFEAEDVEALVIDHLRENGYDL